MMHFLRLLAFSACLMGIGLGNAQFSSDPAPLHADSIPSAQLIQAKELKGLIDASDAAKRPVVLQVGSRVFFTEAHIAGSQYAGPGSQAAGLALLEKTVSSLAKDKFIVLYCGCCPWGRCPNVGPAYKRLHDLGIRM